MDPFRPTHRIAAFGKTFPVMLVEDDEGSNTGPAYTAEEWDADDYADWELSADDGWTFQGRAVACEVVPFDDRTRVPRGFRS